METVEEMTARREVAGIARKNRQKRISCTSDDIAEGSMGACLACGEMADGVEPDAREYECESCGAKKVYGLEEILMMGLIDLQDED